MASRAATPASARAQPEAKTTPRNGRMLMRNAAVMPPKAQLKRYPQPANRFLVTPRIRLRKPLCQRTCTSGPLNATPERKPPSLTNLPSFMSSTTSHRQAPVRADGLVGRAAKELESAHANVGTRFWIGGLPGFRAENKA